MKISSDLGSQGRNYTDYTELTEYRVNKTDGEMGKKSDEDPSHFWYNGLVLPLVCSFGIFINVVFVIIPPRNKREINSTFSTLVTWQSFVDILFLVLTLLIFSLPELWPTYKTVLYPHIFPYLLPAINIALTGSIYSMVSLSAEHYFCITSNSLRDKGALFGYIFPVCVLSGFLSMPKFFLYDTKINNDGKAWVEPLELRKSFDHVYVIISNVIITGVVPTILLLVLLFKSWGAQRNSRATSLTRSHGDCILPVFNLLCSCCHFPRNYLNIHEITQVLLGEPQIFPHMWMIDLSHVMLASFSSSVVLTVALQGSNFSSLLSLLKKSKFVLSRTIQGFQEVPSSAPACPDEPPSYLAGPASQPAGQMNTAEVDLRTGLSKYRSRTSLDTFPSAEFLE